MDHTNDQNQVPLPAPSQPQAVGGVSKEAEPPVVVPEIVKHSAELEVPKEVAEHVVVQKDTVDIPPDLVQKGITQAPQDQSFVSVTDSDDTDLPLTDDQIGEGLTEKPSSSFRWMAAWCVRQLRYMHMHLKKVHGHFIRVKDR